MPPYRIVHRGQIYKSADSDTSSDNKIKFTRRVLHDWERDDWAGYVWRNRLPQVFRCGDLENSDNGHYVPLNKEWQFFWFDICCKTYYGRYHDELTSAEYEWLANRWTMVGGDDRAFMNNKGLNKLRNYVLNINKEKEDAAIYTLWTGGNATRETRVVRNSKGKLMAEIPSFDGNNPPPDVRTINIKTDPRIFVATVIRDTKVSGGGYSVGAFPQFKKNNVPQDVPVILISTKKIYYPIKWMESISSEVKTNPYNPAKSIFLNYPYKD